jgi:hypothetical protein
MTRRGEGRPAVPLKDVLAAVPAAVLGVYMTVRTGRNRDTNRWNGDGWDFS